MRIIRDADYENYCATCSKFGDHNTRNHTAQFDLISKVGYRETLVCTKATKAAAQACLAQYQAMEREMPGCYPNLFIRQAY